MSARRAGTQIEIAESASGENVDNLGQEDGDAVEFTMGSPIADIKCVADISVEDEQQHARNC